MLKRLIRIILPPRIISAYHYILARIADAVYNHPSEKMIVIGVTGTNGKSSTVQFIGRILEHIGERIGWTTTVSFKVAEREWSNSKKMTMLGRFQTQKLLREMVRARCDYAIIETSSQGILQSRHIGIHYDVAVFTNLTPEHIEAHGGFEQYKRAKGELFAQLARSRQKVIRGKKINKLTIVNALDEHSAYFLDFSAGEPYVFGKDVENLQIGASATRFSIDNIPFLFKPIGRFNFENVLAAITTCRALGFELSKIAEAVSVIEPIPGRMELIDEEQPFHVIVDYAYEPAGLQAVYSAVELVEHTRLIHIVGSAGGGRDKARREILGAMSAKHDDIVIVTNEDPYDEDPMQIINDVAGAAVLAGKTDGKNLFRVLDRQEAINMAMKMAEKNDLVLITGKGCEPVMAVARGKKIPWDDRVAARKAIHDL